MLQFQQLAAAIDARQRSQNHVQNLTGGTKRLTMFSDTTGTGEGLLQLAFPVQFSEKPAYTYGWEVTNNWPLILQEYPTLSMGVYRWNIQYAADTGLRAWVGATMLVVITGPLTQVDTLTIETHAQFEGRTLQGVS